MYSFEFCITRYIGFLTNMNRKRQIIECLSVITKYRSAAFAANDKSAFRVFLFFQTQMRFSIPPTSIFEGIIGSVILCGIRNYRTVKNIIKPVYTECIQNVRKKNDGTI